MNKRRYASTDFYTRALERASEFEDKALDLWAGVEVARYRLTRGIEQHTKPQAIMDNMWDSVKDFTDWLMSL